MIPQSRFLPYFRDNAAQLRESLELIGDILLVERIQFPEHKSASGLILASAPSNQFNSMAADAPTFYRVLLAGAGFYDDETKESVPLDIAAGDIVLTGSVSVRMFSMVPLLQIPETNLLGITRHGDIQGRWKGDQALLQFLTGLNESVQAEVARGKANLGT